jgi:hypothetical protein
MPANRDFGFRFASLASRSAFFFRAASAVMHAGLLQTVRV